MVVAVNKMDLVGYDKDVFEKIQQDYKDFTENLDIPNIHFIPVSALTGDNVVDNSTKMPWYHISSNQFKADLVWMDQQTLSLTRKYELKLGSKRINARIKKFITLPTSTPYRKVLLKL